MTFQTLEQQISGRVVADLLAAGYSISVHDGEDVACKRSRDAETIKKALASTDEDFLYVHRPNAGGIATWDHTRTEDCDGWVRLVWGNDRDVISDHTTNLESIMAPIYDEIEAVPA